MRELWRDLCELALPSACADCGGPLLIRRSAAPLCPTCYASLPRLACELCTLCQLLPVSGGVCAGCSARPSPLAACVAASPFQGAVEDWIHRFKYPATGLSGLDPAAEHVLGALICEAGLRLPGEPPELVVPIPLHPRRLRMRGFNPAALLARALATRIAVPWNPRALERTRDTPSQTGLGRAARRRNLAGAFRVRAKARLPGSVWLVDDVVTTGSTLQEAARSLRRTGVRSVAAVCVARTLISR